MVRQDFPRVRLIANSENRGFGAANNQALHCMQGRYALLLNSDTVLTEKAVYELFSFMEAHPGAAMACGQLLNRDGSKQHSFANFPNLVTLMTNAPLLEALFPRRYPSKRYRYKVPIEVDSGIGACLMVRKAAMDQVGLFDERYFFFFEETDWAYAMHQAGWENLLCAFCCDLPPSGAEHRRQCPLPDRILPFALPVFPEMEAPSLLPCRLCDHRRPFGGQLASDGCRRHSDTGLPENPAGQVGCLFPAPFVAPRFFLTRL